MLPLTIPLTELKKDYKFLWFIDGLSTEDINSNKNESLYLMQQFTLKNPVYCGYISQLAEQVNLPDDEFEIEQMENGPVTYEIPKKVKLANIQVTYLEDSLNSVYNFHKTWFNMIRGGTGLYFNSPTKLCAKARYIEFEDTLVGTEYIAYYGQQTEILKRALTSGLSAEVTAGLTSAIESMKPEIPFGAKPTGITTYPRIYPTKISRSSANKQGMGLHKVTVTYSRIPEFIKKHTNLQMLKDGEWKDVKR